MLSFASLALAVVALSAQAFASMDASDIFEHSLVKRRVNHADEYGYPHHLGPHINNGQKMTPGGFVDPHHTNLGHQCRYNTECHNGTPLAVGVCEAGACSFRCLGASRKQGNKCIGVYKPPMCKKDANCPKTTIANAHSVCYQNQCTFACASGFHTNGNSCVKQLQQCGGKPKPFVENGYAVCKQNQWQPECASYLGFTLHKFGRNYLCTNILTDPQNCGYVGHKCPRGYNGLGIPTCSRGGHCGLDCSGYNTHKLYGQTYCSTQ